MVLASPKKLSPAALIRITDEVDTPALDRIFSQCLSKASGPFTEDHKRAIAQGRASLYMAPDRGFVLFGKRYRALVILAAAGRHLVTREGMAIIDKLALAECCDVAWCEVRSKVLARKLCGLGWRLENHAGKYLALSKAVYDGL